MPHRHFAAPRAVLHREADGTLVLRSAIPLPAHAPRITDAFLAHAAARPDAALLRWRADGAWRTLRWGDAADRAASIAGALLARGLSAERPVAIIAGNSAEHALLVIAAKLAGVPVAAISPAALTAPGDRARLRRMLALLTPGLILSAFPDPALFDLPEIAGAAIVLPARVAGLRASGFADLEAPGAALPPPPDPDAPAKIVFTSGSTSAPKGVVLTQRMMAANQAQIAAVWPFLRASPPELLCWLPWSHVFGGTHNLNMVLVHGGTLWIDEGRPLPGAIAATLANLGAVSPTAYFNVPRGYDLLLPALEADADLARRFFARLVLAFVAGAALPEALWRRLDALARRHAPQPVAILSAWGLTETTPAAVMAHGHGLAPGSLGLPLPGVELRLVPDGAKHEARIAGPNVARGYWRDAEATRGAFDAAGFFRSGDALALLDPARPEAGLRFDGRLAEDFKLATGARVNAGALRLDALAAFADLAREVVVTGHDRAEIGLLIVPHEHRRAAAGGAALAAGIADALARLNATASGSATRVARARLLADPPSIDHGEATEKGSINIRALLDRRAAEVARLYDDAAEGTVLAPR